jgi:hypothetical protein
MWTAIKSNEAKTQQTMSSLGKQYFKADWSRQKFFDSSLEDLRKVFEAVSSGSGAAVRKLGPLLTEDMQIALERGIEDSKADCGAVQGAEVVQSLVAPALVQARAVFPSLAQGRPGMAPRPTHVQVTLEHKLLVRPFALVPDAAAAVAETGGWRARLAQQRKRSRAPVAAGAVVSGASGSGYTSDGYGSDSGYSSSEGSLASEVRQRSSEEWEPVQDETSGLVFWAHGRGVMGFEDAPFPWRRTWEAPPPTQLRPRRGWRIELAGIEREPISVPRQGGEGEEMLVRVTQHVVWERAVPPPGTINEALAASPATARWRIAKL